jgi:hypothetical protein
MGARAAQAQALTSQEGRNSQKAAQEGSQQPTPALWNVRS